jgi:hypothetical protein
MSEILLSALSPPIYLWLRKNSHCSARTLAVMRPPGKEAKTLNREIKCVQAYLCYVPNKFLM